MATWANDGGAGDRAILSTVRNTLQTDGGFNSVFKGQSRKPSAKGLQLKANVSYNTLLSKIINEYEDQR